MPLLPLTYLGMHLDRADALRKDQAWISEQLQQQQTRILPVWRNRNLVRNFASTQPQAAYCLREHADALLQEAAEIVFLGQDQGTAYFCADVSRHDEVKHQSKLGIPADLGEFIDLRQAAPLLSQTDAALLAYARGILYWHRHHQFCGRCGGENHSQHGGHMRLCANANCEKQTFPRTDPAVIMLVEYRGENGEPPTCLLGHHGRLPDGMYSTLAGFVEPGESLEEAVVREVFEETGVRVGDAIYQASQPWPFPGSIMVGFRAQALSTEIQLDLEELADARWFSAEEVAQFGDWGDESSKLRIPRADSISRYLIDSWVAEVLA